MEVTVRIPLQPVPASRPRVTRWGAYYTKTYKTWIAAAMQLVNDAKAPLAGALHVTTEAVFERARTSKLEYPRADNDNLEKAAWDLLTKKGYWHDDNQIVQNETTKRFALKGETPHTAVTIRHL